MTEEARAAEATEEVTTEGASEAPVSSQEPGNQAQEETPRDFEAEAREMGWVPESEFRGPKELWKDAETFVKKGTEILPIVNARNKKLQDQLEKQEAEFQKRLERMERVNKSTREREAKRYEAEISRIKREKMEAVKAGDEERYQALETEQESLAKPEEEPDPQPNNATVQQEWIAKNEWYRTDFKAAREAREYSQWLAEQNPSITMADNLAQTEAHMKKEHPELFGEKPKKPAANGHAAVDGGSDFPSGGKKSLLDTLPAEAKAQFRQDVKDGLYKEKDAESWAKVYLGK